MSDLVKKIDAILPQTQCGLCGYNGCMPYAQALADSAATINLCPPGGVKGLFAIAEMVNQDPTPFITDMEQKAKPAMRAIIREAECIGCVKCIKACPVDAILGSAKQMHTVIADECTGCELCIAPCPVDCIEMVAIPQPIEDKKDHYRKRYQAHQNRLTQDQQSEPKVRSTSSQILADKKNYIKEALMRAKAKKEK